MKRVIIFSSLVLIFQLNLYSAENPIKTTISLIYFSEIEKSDEDLSSFLKVAERNLSSYKGFEYFPIEIILDKRQFNSMYSDFKKAIRYISEGKLHYENMDFENSFAAFTKAIKLFEKNNLFINKRQLYLETMTYLGAISLLSGRPDEAIRYFKEIITIDSKYRPDASLFPPQITEFYKNLTKETLSSAKCVLRFRTEPENAKIYLDGEFIGLSPIDRTGILCGNHYYYILADGYKMASQAFNIDQRSIVKEVTERLSASDEFDLLNKIQNQLKQGIQTDEYPPILQALSDIDQVIIVYATGSRDRPLLSGLLYDNIGKNRINIYSLNLSRPISESQKEVDGFVTSVYLEIGSRKIIPPSVFQFTGENSIDSGSKKIDSKDNLPVYKKWWFWIAIAGATAILISVPVILINTAENSSRGPDDHLDPFLRK